jgi:hypothetical protein
LIGELLTRYMECEKHHKARWFGVIKISDYLQDGQSRNKVKYLCDMFKAQELTIFENDKILIVIYF